MQKIILASQSPRRQELLARLGVEFEVVPSDFDESSVQCNEVNELVEELALQKALKVAEQVEDGLVVGGDTVVWVNGEVLGKANNKQEARESLLKLLGNHHEVVTGVAVVDALTGESWVESVRGGVSFREVSEVELKKYLDEESWRGFAGCYAIQGRASKWVLEQTGSLSAIIGLPLIMTAELLEKMGVMIEVNPREVEEELWGNKWEEVTDD